MLDFSKIDFASIGQNIKDTFLNWETFYESPAFIGMGVFLLLYPQHWHTILGAALIGQGAYKFKVNRIKQKADIDKKAKTYK